MSKYTTGEMGKLCDISVRTVQFYDTKGLLHPSELTEGGRRLYTDDDLTKLRLICTLKAIGLSLDSIKGVLESESPGKILTLLLDEQLRRLGDEIKERQSQIGIIKIIKDCTNDMTAIPVNTINDIEHMMKNKKGLRKVRGAAIVGGTFMTTGLVTTILLWTLKGIWLPFVIWVPIYILLAVMIIGYTCRHTAYICPECNKTFRPTAREAALTSGWKTRWLTCPNCDHKGYCVEIYAKGAK